MNKAALTIFTLTLLLSITHLSGLSFLVKATGTIYIRADGSIEGTDRIERDGNLYTFTDNIYDEIVVERSNTTIDGAGHTVNGSGTGEGFTLTNINNVTIKNLTIKRFHRGIQLSGSSSNTISGNNITTNNDDGIQLHESSSNTISGNNIIANNGDGIQLSGSSNYNTISGNNITTNNRDGVFLYESSSNCISGNNITTNNYDGIYLCESSNYNTISGNNIITNNWDGIELDYSSSNSIHENNIIDNDAGISFYLSYGNEIYHNNFIENTQQVIPSGYSNFWDDGYPSGGNYWSDYIGVDVYAGVDQDVFGSDGIGDSIRYDDRYPLVSSWPCHDVAIVNITVVDVVGFGVLLPINVTVSNQGDFAEVFNITLYVDGISVGTQTLSSARAVLSLTFFCNTSCVRVGLRRVRAWVTAVQGEVDFGDNGFDCWIEVIPDLDGDKKVGIQDIVLVARAYGAQEGDPNWNPIADMAPYFGRIDIFDVVTCAYYYGRTCARNVIYQLSEIWSTTNDLKTPESVIFDYARNILYVSNINGGPLEKNGNGFISKVSVSGEIETLEWIAELNAPKGMAIWQNILYVSDIDELVEIDIETGTILNRYQAENALFLNDVAVDGSGNVYVSDMSSQNSVIYIFTDGILDVWLRSEQISRPNGLFYENGRIIVGTDDGYLKAIDLLDKFITTIAETGFGIDGVQGIDGGDFFVSDWNGKIAIVSSTGEVTELLNTAGSNINSADIEYIPEDRVLLIPTFHDNRVVAYKVQREASNYQTFDPQILDK